MALFLLRTAAPAAAAPAAAPRIDHKRPGPQRLDDLNSNPVSYFGANQHQSTQPFANDGTDLGTPTRRTVPALRVPDPSLSRDQTTGSSA